MWLCCGVCWFFRFLGWWNIWLGRLVGCSWGIICCRLGFLCRCCWGSWLLCWCCRFCWWLGRIWVLCWIGVMWWRSYVCFVGCGCGWIEWWDRVIVWLVWWRWLLICVFLWKDGKYGFVGKCGEWLVDCDMMSVMLCCLCGGWIVFSMWIGSWMLVWIMWRFIWRWMVCLVCSDFVWLFMVVCLLCWDMEYWCWLDIWVCVFFWMWVCMESWCVDVVGSVCVIFGGEFSIWR